MNKAKILFVNPYESSLFSFRKELLDALLKEGYEIVLCINKTQRIVDEYGDSLKIIDVKMNLKDKDVFSNLKVKRQYKQIIESEKPNLILSFGIKPNLYCGIHSKDVPIIANITGLGNIFSKRGVIYKIGLRLYKRAFKNIDHIFFQNENSKEFFFENNINVNKYDIIPGSGVNTERFALAKENELSNKTRFLFASRAMKEKGYDLLLQAIPLVLEKNNDVSFTILSLEEDVFSDKRATDLRNMFKGKIEILPKADDMSCVYGRYHFVVAPSYYREGISNVLLESLSCGRPIITTLDNPGCKEVLIDGINGFGVKSNDLDSLIEALLKASSLTNKQVYEMGYKGREFVKKNFDRSIVVNKYLETISALIGDK